MSNLIKRALTGTVFVAVLIASIYFGEDTTLFVFLSVILLMIREFFMMAQKSKDSINPNNGWGLLTGLFFFVGFALAVQKIIPYKVLYLAPAFIFFTFVIELYRNKTNPFTNIAFTLLANFYITLPFCLLYHLGFYSNYTFQDEFSYQLILGIFILLWANDTGAYLAGSYLAGKLLGQHKLFERISPNKTWVGSIGGGLLSVISAYILSLYFTNLNVVDWIIISLIIVVFGGIGDLIESMLKRSFKVKNSGNLLPGHGGFLDRFDGILIAAPFVYVYLQLIC